jgi:hypothetical protein
MPVSSSSTSSTSSTLLSEYFTFLFGNIEELLQLSQYFYFEMESLLNHSHHTSSKLMIGKPFLETVLMIFDSLSLSSFVLLFLIRKNVKNEFSCFEL